MELDNIKIEKIVSEEVRHFLKEELSISSVVDETSKSITSIICKGEFDFTYPLYDIGEYRIIGRPYEVNSESQNTYKGGVNTQDKTIEIHVPIYNGRILRSVVSKTVYHELEHAYQLSKKGNAKYGSFNELYEKATEYVANDASNYNITQLSKLIYCCAAFEQDAFANELYSQFMNIDIFNKEEKIKIFMNSSIYKALMMIRDVRSELTDMVGTEDYTNAFKYFNRPPRWFVYLANNGEKRIVQKIRHIFKKANKDKGKGILSKHINLDAVNIP